MIVIKNSTVFRDSFKFYPLQKRNYSIDIYPLQKQLDKTDNHEYDYEYNYGFHLTEFKLDSFTTNLFEQAPGIL